MPTPPEPTTSATTTADVPRDPAAWQRLAADVFVHVNSHDGTAIAWRVDGPTDPDAWADAPVVVLCNGIACDHGYWRDVWPILAASCRVVRWHYRAHGRSGPPANPEEVIISSVVRDLLAVMDAAGVDRATLAGHSYGVQVACETLRSAPDRVAGLVAVAGAYGHPLGTILGRNTGAMAFSLIQLALWPAPKVTTGLLRAAMATPAPYWVARAIGGMGSGIPREIADDYFAHVAALDVSVLLRMMRAMQEHTSADVLPTIAVPTTILAGTRDRMTPAKLAREMAAAIAGSRLVEVPRATHVLPSEEPELVAAEILDTVAATQGETV